MTRPRLLDLYCKAGGAGEGYARAGWDVTGVDIEAQPHYPHRFIRADALAFPIDDFDAVHASPPCQAYTSMRGLGRGVGVGAPDLVAATRARLVASGLPYIIENVMGAPMLDALMLCGSMFGLGVRRHRLFESSHLLFGPGPCRHDSDVWPVAVWGDGRPSRQEVRREHRGPIAVYGDHPEDSAIHRRGGMKPGSTRRAATLAVAQAAMGIDWMTWREITQAIPPAYTQHLGAQLLRAVEHAA